MADAQHAPCDALPQAGETALLAPRLMGPVADEDADTADSDIVVPLAFKQKWTDWQSQIQRWKKLQKDWKGKKVDVSYPEPPFSQFYFEDWALLGFRCALHLLLHSCPHAGRPILPLDRFPAYYNKYIQEHFYISAYGFTEFSQLASIITDTITINGDNLVPCLGAGADLETFVQLTEDKRQDRIRCVGEGDLSALLNFKIVKAVC